MPVAKYCASKKRNALRHGHLRERETHVCAEEHSDKRKKGPANCARVRARDHFLEDAAHAAIDHLEIPTLSVSLTRILTQHQPTLIRWR